ncbi:nucleotide excision repair complex subunit XPC-like protein isoform 1 [Galdieria sulphuraria]|uniref:Nucleotide excision repair complex subunit XPC-like protein isoform 1 n=1 Tax=Galdieria sulphuraria TaxID=130081 RepID=M2X168_GALSU|nr:nucleotide excision repair complex subunit XPC-like protein isoform 1 [Galdieria sulphuraria]EME30110.1 nucleotide excision repair complex subunit XPC-like protein isoform 1 [Galdieria sulphuraria]|eukprot:XP_005706630.1 nucleotide excision repair complex subunit XPC-like protein isoform 1 [Galdieria sulphuraria]
MTQKSNRKHSNKANNQNTNDNCKDSILQVEQTYEEYEDIEWSEASVPVDNAQEETTAQESRTSSTTLIECSKEQSATSSKVKSPYSKEDRLQALRMHKTHLLILLSSLMKLNELASDPLVIGSCLSVIPRDCLLSEEETQATVEDWKEKCRRLVLFCCHFVGQQKRILNCKDYGNYMFWQPFHIQQWLESPRPVASLFVVFVCAIFRGLGMRCRLVQSLIPFQRQPWWTRDEVFRDARKRNSTVQHSNTNNLSCCDDSFWWLFAPWMMELALPGSLYCKEMSCHSLESLPCIYWLEVYSPLLQRWVHIDPFHLLIDEPSWVESSYKKWKWHPFRQRMIYPIYITAIENVRDDVTIIRDVTLRYISLSIIRNQRLKDEFWEKTMEAFSHTQYQRNIIQSDVCIIHEEREWEYWNNMEPIPNQIQKLKGHPQYVLEMHLKKYEAIYPKDRILGYCGEYPVYPRSNVHILHTRDGWIREMRQVLKDQVAWKRVKTKRNANHEEGTELFGIWQTEPFTPPSVENGKVPKNKRGQVDLWSKSHLPQGCIHVRYSNAAMIAKRLSLDYAPAMIGFDIHQGRSVPILDGIVIAKEYQEVIEDACRQDCQHKEDEQMKRRYERALQLWKACIRHVQSQLRVSHLEIEGNVTILL